MVSATQIVTVDLALTSVVEAEVGIYLNGIGSAVLVVENNYLLDLVRLF